jgi:hypothetical protein
MVNEIEFFSGLDRKISVRATREELIERGILLPDVASVSCQPQLDVRFREREAAAATSATLTTMSSASTASSAITANG